MADTAEQVRRVVARLRARGFTVEEIPGWETRGKGPMTTVARLEHHTAGARTGDAPSLRVVTFGRPGLRNSLSRWHVARTSGIIRLIALGVSWHAGKGIHGTNTTLSGTEAENTGTGEPWTQASLHAQAAISQEEAREFGFSTDRVFDHREHAPDRKIDRHGIDPTTWRQRLRRAPIIEQEDDDVNVIAHRSDGSVWHITGGIRIRATDPAIRDAAVKSGARDIGVVSSTWIATFPWPREGWRPGPA